MNYEYPGSHGEYSKQAWSFTGIVALVSAVVMAVVYMTDRYVIAGGGIGMERLTLLLLIVTVAGIIAQLMARSLAGFSITAGGKVLAIKRGRSIEDVPYGEIKSLNRKKLPVFWPLRADLKPRSETARYMISIKRGSKPSITFVGGLDDEEQLLETIRVRAGLV